MSEYELNPEGTPRSLYVCRNCGNTVLQISNEPDELEGIAGLISIGPGFVAFLMSQADSLEASTQFTGFLIGLAVIPISAYHIYNGLLRGNQKNTVEGDNQF